MSSPSSPTAATASPKSGSSKRKRSTSEGSEAAEIASIGDAGLRAEEVELARAAMQLQQRVPLLSFLDFCGSMDQSFKREALRRTAASLADMAGSGHLLGVVKIASEAQLLLRLDRHTPKAVNTELAKHAPAGNTLLWEPIAAYVQRCSDLGLETVNVYVLTDGEDNRSCDGWRGIDGVIRLMELARRLAISVVVSIVQLGGTDQEQQNMRTAAGLTGGSFLHIHLNEADPEQVAVALGKITAFGQALASTLGSTEQRSVVARRNLMATARELQGLGSVSASLRGSADFTSLELASMIDAARRSGELLGDVAVTLLSVLQDLVHKGTQQIHANVLRDLVFKARPASCTTMHAKGMAHVYNASLLPRMQAVMTRSQAATGVWTFGAGAASVLSLIRTRLDEFSAQQLSPTLPAQPSAAAAANVDALVLPASAEDDEDEPISKRARPAAPDQQ
jgi:hypothetical protein